MTKALETGIGSDRVDSLVSATRTSLGDSLRSVVYFTPSAFDVLYVRQDLYASDDAAREVKAELVSLEQVGFAERPVRTTIAHRDIGSDIGPYNFTVRFHENGFVVRVLQDDVGVLFTADSMDVSAFEEAISAIRGVLRGE
ncbi:hypothetical protein ACFPM1_11910 [Halorubrum rubrum]|uniref:Uncharacterized protein n=1 Tax=Halorubrum rubrum TaxID=1126240 RepID=A0ABD5R393_9EURY|nr:hypothetical protein [Halorubrum rubrum]